MEFLNNLSLHKVIHFPRANAACPTIDRFDGTDNLLTVVPHYFPKEKLEFFIILGVERIIPIS